MVTPGWEKRLKPASFRGVPFGTFDYDTSGGRRVALHEYPWRDDNYPEDMGLATDGYQINAFLIGDDHDLKADALEAALCKKGSGTLVHQRHGTLEVQLQTYSRSESTGAGGMTKFSLNFIKANKPRYPAAAQNVQSLALELLNRLRSNSLFQTLQRVTSIYNQLRDGSWLTLQLTQLASLLAPLSFLLPSGTSGKVGNSPTLSGFLFDATSALNALAILPAAPTDAVSGGWLAQAANLDVTILDSDRTRATNAAVELLQSLPVGTDGALPPANLYLMHTAAAVELVTQAATSAALVEYSSYDAALAARDQAHALLDAALPVLPIITGATPATLYEDWRELRALIASAIQQQALTLPKVAYAQVEKPQPALVLGYRIHHDATRATDLISRNRIAHPLFASGALEYLTNG
ncbi:MAG: hypothetical protein BWK73_19120 [Thiothrix lacustris]|uniref:DNA circulation N-terminal domain-containing protein n=1 Tax=Thiothrix lacustris TaxID=525917 RepID=A0A1Y1QPN8_9GAMM|nr:MAG: hypothetical protein BWK73_19120 [Thiothrix lacustris]